MAYPVGSRVFLGNLATERVSENEIREVFSKYGDIKEITIKKGFGFIQYGTPETANRVVESEKYRILGGLAVDIKIATGDRKRTQGGTG